MSHHDEDAAEAHRAVTELRKREILDATKTAVKELIDEYVQIFGWWSLKTVAVALVGAGLIAILWAEGWHK